MTGEIVKEKNVFTTLNEGVIINLIGVPSVSRYRKTMTRRLFNYFLFTCFSFFDGYKLINRNERNVKILLNISPPFAVLSGYILSRFRKKASLILEVTDLPESVFELGMFNNKIIQRLTGKFYDHVYRKCDFIMPLTYGAARSIENRGIIKEKIVPIPNWINEDVGMPNNFKEIREKNGWDDYFIVMYAGGHGKAYDLMTLIRAAELLEKEQDIKIVMLGDGERKKEYMRYCKERNIKSCEFYPPVSRNELRDNLAAADVCVNLFYQGDFWKNVVGHKIIDYLEVARPVIFCGIGETADIIKRSGGGIVVEPENAYELSRAIIELSKDKKACRIMGERGREFLKREFAREDLLQKLDRVLGLKVNSTNSN